MAALIGYVQGNRGECHRTGTKESGITATLETWQHGVELRLHADGAYTVRIGRKGSAGQEVHRGFLPDDVTW